MQKPNRGLIFLEKWESSSIITMPDMDNVDKAGLVSSRNVPYRVLAVGDAYPLAGMLIEPCVVVGDKVHVVGELVGGLEYIGKKVYVAREQDVISVERPEPKLTNYVVKFTSG